MKEEEEAIITFDPLIPQVNMVHIYIKASLKDCLRIRDEIKIKLGISLFERIRSINNDTDTTENKKALHCGYQCKLELTIGQANGCIPDNIFVQGWTEFCKLI